MSRRIKYILPVLTLIVIASAYYLLDEEPAGTVKHKLVRVSRGELSSMVSATGTLSPLITVQVGSQVSGSIQRLYVDFNDPVSKGQVIARLDPALFKARVAQAEANLKSAEAERDKARVSVRDSERRLKRRSTLYEQEMIAENELDEAQFAWESAVVGLRASEAAVSQAGAALEQARVNLAYTTIYAPIDGVVISRDVDVGQTVAASLQAPTLYTIAKNLEQMQIETEVDEAFIGRIDKGFPVTFTVFAYLDRVFRGEVAQVRLNPKVESGVVKYNCIIHVNNEEGLLKPGMTATVAIEVERRENVLKVPNAAFRYVGDYPPDRLKKLRDGLGKGEAVIWSPAGQGLKPLKVRLGLAGEEETEVSGEGVAEGMEVAVAVSSTRESGRRRRGFRLF